jgi:hypothetical protein
MALHVLDFALQVRLGRKACGRANLGNALLGAILALVLLASATFASNHILHRLIHEDAPVNDHSCLACSLIKGQVAAAEPAPLLVAVVSSLCLGIRSLPACLLPGNDYCFSESRAPPVS